MTEPKFDGESLLPDESELPTPREEALPFTHAHNDYEHEYPLFDALSYGFVSVESDIWLYPNDNDNLRVAHDPVDEPTILPTFEELYLDPLQELKEEFDNGGIYADGTPLTLLIDIKSEGLATYQILDEVLAEYEAESPGFLTTYTLDKSGEYTVTPGAVTPIISGDRPLEFMQSQEVRYAGYDGQQDDIGTGIDPGLMPLISDNWDDFFQGELAWDGIGKIPEDTEAELNEIVTEVQGEDKSFRFWNLPQDAPSVWQPLYEAGVDLINTDNLEGLSTFIESQLESEVEPVEPTLEIWEFGTLEADTLEIEGSNNLVFAGEGNDLVDASTAEGGNRIYGDGGDDTFILGTGDRLVDGEGADRFVTTSGGDNTITGGEGADQFWIASAEIPDAANIITDFTSGEDVIGIAGLGIGFDDLSITDLEGDALITASGSELAIFSGVDATTLTEEDFTFA